MKPNVLISSWPRRRCNDNNKRRSKGNRSLPPSPLKSQRSQAVVVRKAGPGGDTVTDMAAAAVDLRFALQQNNTDCGDKSAYND
jgi:hypothetical protein